MISHKSGYKIVVLLCLLLSSLVWFCDAAGIDSDE